MRREKELKILKSPQEFHTLIKLESGLKGMTMTDYMTRIVREVKKKDCTLENYFKRQYHEKEKQNEKNKFSLRF
jgi:hypothetical protein